MGRFKVLADLPKLVVQNFVKNKQRIMSDEANFYHYCTISSFMFVSCCHVDIILTLVLWHKGLPLLAASIGQRGEDSGGLRACGRGISEVRTN